MQDFAIKNKEEIFLEEPQILFQDYFKTQDKAEKSDFCMLSNVEGSPEILELDKKSTEITQGNKEVFEKSQIPQPPAQLKADKVIHRRWGRKQDKNLFQIIRDMEAEGLFVLDDLVALDENEDLYQYEGIRQLCSRACWRATPAKLLGRIKTLRDTKFSFREIKALKKLLRDGYEYENIDYDKVLYDFPGKTMEKLREMCDELVSSFHQKSLSGFISSKKRLNKTE